MLFTEQDASKLCVGPICKHGSKWAEIANTALEFCQSRGLNAETSRIFSINVANNFKVTMEKFGISDITDVKFLNSNYSEHTISLESAVIEEGMIKGATAIKPGWSKNKRYYSPEVLAQLVPLIKEYSMVFLNHRDERLGRDLRDLIGTITEVWQEADGTIKCNISLEGNPELNWVIERIEANQKLLALSIASYLLTEMGEAEGIKGPIVTKFLGHHSVDIVYYPGAQGGFETTDSEYLVSDPKTALFLYSISNENFAEYVNSRVWGQLLMWLDDYLFWIVITGGLTADEKLDMITKGFDLAKEMYVDIVDKLGWLNDDSELSDSGTESLKVNSTPSIPKLLEPYAEKIQQLTQQIEVGIMSNEAKPTVTPVANVTMTEHLEAVNKYQTQVLTLTADKTALETEIEALKKELETLKTDLDTATKSIQEKDAQLKSIEDEKNASARLNEINALVTKLEMEGKVPEVFLTNWQESSMTLETIEAQLTVLKNKETIAVPTGVTTTGQKPQTKEVTAEFNLTQLSR